jgi:hypothetical protein
LDYPRRATIIVLFMDRSSNTNAQNLRPDWWAEALIPLDDIPASALRDV